MSLTAISGKGQRLHDSPAQVRLFPKHPAGIRAIACDGTGRRAVSACDDCRLRLWDTMTGKEIRCLEGHTAGARCVVFTPDGQRLLSGSADGSLRLWDAQTGEEQRQFRGHAGTVTAVAVAPDGKEAASAGRDGTVRLWSLPQVTDAGTTDPHGLKTEVFRDLELRERVLTRIDRQIDWFYEYTPRYPGVAPNRFSVRWTGWLRAPRAGRYRLFLRSDDGVRLWLDGKQLVNQWRRRMPETDRVEVELADRPHALQLEYFQDDGCALMSLRWEQDGTLPQQVIPAAALFHDEEAARRATVSLVQEKRRFEGDQGEVLCLAYAPEGRQLLAGGKDGTLRLWDTEAGAEVGRLVGHSGAVRAVAFSADGQRAASAGADGTVRVWNVASRRELARAVGHEAGVNAVVFFHDRPWLLSGGGDRTLRLWDAENGKPVACFEGHGAAVFGVAVGPQKNRVLSGSGDGTLRLWQPPQ
jgi:WD40 repeat protein